MMVTYSKGDHEVRESCIGILKRHTTTQRIENTRKVLENKAIELSRLL